MTLEVAILRGPAEAVAVSVNSAALETKEILFICMTHLLSGSGILLRGSANACRDRLFLIR
jgi:hypothetical protein